MAIDLRHHPSSDAEVRAQQLALALQQRRIPPACHYLSARQSELWQAVAAAHSPAGDETVQAAYAEAFAWMASRCSGEAMHLVALGAGSGAKERQLAKALQDRASPLRFTAVDVSETLARLAADKVGELAAPPVHGVVADVLQCDELLCWLADFDGEMTRLFTAFGLSPNVRPAAFFKTMAGLLDGDRAAGDVALISANLVPAGEDADAELLAQYDNAATRLWLGQVLLDWGLSPESTELEFALDEIEGVVAVVVTMAWPGGALPDTVPMAARRWLEGESVELFFSLRYSTETFRSRAESAGLCIEATLPSQCGREAIFVLSRSHANPIASPPPA